VREPDIPRVASGTGKIPNRVPRLKALGNAVVPAQIYPLFAAIARIHNSEER
jgi:DNA (cytosine-5)-methyltransferase 1